MKPDTSARIADSWIVNAEAWTTAVREGRIASRRAATDRAIVEALLGCAPQRVLDVGCGEGWLCRALAEHAIGAFGIDASPPLIDTARLAGGDGYAVCDYQAMIDSPRQFGRFDAAVCNFALLEEAIDPLLAALRSTLGIDGRLFIQTVHPRIACGDLAYIDGWRTETFTAFGEAFVAQMPWYFRTLESWCETLVRCGYAIEALREPAHPKTGQPLSLLLVAQPRD